MAQVEQPNVRRHFRALLDLCSCPAVIGAVVVTVVRAVFVGNRRAISLTPDEIANLGMARYLSGGSWWMTNTPTWRPGLGALMAPLHVVFDDPATLIRIGLVVNVVLGGLAVLLLVPIVRRLTDVGEVGATAVSVLIALMPSSLVASAHVWAEPAVTLVFLGVVFGLMRFYDGPTIATGALVVAVSAVGYTFHGRLLPLVGVTVLFLMMGAGRRRPWWSVLFAIEGLVLVGLSNLFATSVFDAVWARRSDDNSTTSVVRRAGLVAHVLESLAGQIWYLLAGSALTFGFGLVVLVRRAWSGRGRDALSRDSALVLGLTLPMLLVSAIFMADRPRPDQLIYGRYNAAIVWPIIAVGAHWLFSGRRAMSRRAVLWTAAGTAIVFAELGLLQYQLNRNVFASSSGVAQMVSDITPFMRPRQSIPVLLITGGVLAVAFVLAVASRSRHRAVVVATVALLLGVAGVRTHQFFSPSVNAFETTALIRDVAAREIPMGSTIRLSLMPDELDPAVPAARQLDLTFAYEWYLPDYEFELDSGPIPGSYVLAVLNDPLMEDRSATLVWRDRVAEAGLWRDGDVEPGSPAAP